MVMQPTADSTPHSRIIDDTKYASYFQDCVGALDGTHIHAFVPLAEAIPYRNRKGTLSQNVLGVCTFDLQFCFVYLRWEGSAHDVRVLEDAISHIAKEGHVI
jgi:hypothetical protein